MPAGSGDGVALDAAARVGRPASRVCSTSFVDVLEARLRRERRRLLGPPQDADEPAHLGERRAPGLLDGEQRLALALLVVAQQPAHGRGLDGHDAHRVADDVVQLARDARALLGDGGARLASRSRSSRSARSRSSSV